MGKCLHVFASSKTNLEEAKDQAYALAEKIKLNYWINAGALNVDSGVSVSDGCYRLYSLQSIVPDVDAINNYMINKAKAPYTFDCLKRNLNPKKCATGVTHIDKKKPVWLVFVLYHN